LSEISANLVEVSSLPVAVVAAVRPEQRRNPDGSAEPIGATTGRKEERPMNPYLFSPEGWKTVRAAILHGWGPTLRLAAVLAAATACSVLAVLITLLLML
jgi:hypothetical protein